MYKVILFLYLFFYLPGAVFSQNVPAQLNALRIPFAKYLVVKRAQITRDSLEEKYLSAAAYEKYFDRYFTLINYEKESLKDGNAAALKISDNETKLNLNLSKKLPNAILSIGTTLNVTNQSGTLFSKNKPTTGTELSGNYSFLLKCGRKIKFDDVYSYYNYRNRRAILDSIEQVHVQQNPISYATLANKLVETQQEIGSIQHLIDSLELLDANNHPRVFLDSILKHQAVLIEALETKAKTKSSMKDLAFQKPIMQTFTDIRKKVEEIALEGELVTGGLEIFRMRWISTGLVYKRESYATYDSLLLFEKRFDEQANNNWSFVLGYNSFWQRTNTWIDRTQSKGINSLFFNLSYSLSNSNNYSTMKETDVQVIRSFTHNDTLYEFSSTQKIRDVSQYSFKQEWVHKPGIQLTGMLGKKQNVGINLVYNSEFSGTRRPVFNTRIGGVFRFTDADDEKSKVNFEVFIAFNDLSDTKEEHKSVWQRKEIGITASVPFAKVFFK